MYHKLSQVQDRVPRQGCLEYSACGNSQCSPQSNSGTYSKQVSRYLQLSSCNNVPSKTKSPYSPLQNPRHISVIFSTYHSIRLFQSFPPKKTHFPPKKIHHRNNRKNDLHCSSIPIFCLFLLSQKF